MSPQETEIHQCIDAWLQALRGKQLARMLADYDERIVVFDVKPPFQIRGQAAIRQHWEESLPCFPDEFDYERRDVRILHSGDLAVAHWIFHIVGWPAGHPAAQMWMRATVVLERREGRWCSVHEHVSVPFDPENGRPVGDPGR
jgi:uncharacterized protein (TIGR02246 family)